MDIKIRKLKVNEWEKYKNLRLEMLRLDSSAFGKSIEEELQTTEEKWKSRLSGQDIILFATDREKVVGMAAVDINDTKLKQKHIAYIYSVYLQKEYRGQGLGKRLMETIINKIRQKTGIRKIKLGVSSLQKVAIKLYEKLGFKISGIEKEEIFDNGVYYDVILMEMMI